MLAKINSGCSREGDSGDLIRSSRFTCDRQVTRGDFAIATPGDYKFPSISLMLTNKFLIKTFYLNLIKFYHPSKKQNTAPISSYQWSEELLSMGNSALILKETSGAK